MGGACSTAAGFAPLSDSVACSAPGRVNLIGEHTDYNEGYALPTVISQRTTARIRRRSDGIIRVRSTTHGAPPRTVEISALQPAGDWSDYVVGVVWALGDRGVRLGGFDCAVSSDVPVGAGLSSSAALEVAVIRALRDTFELAIDDEAVAEIAHHAESAFVGARVGRMDQLVCSKGREGEALFIDFRDMIVRPIPIDTTKYELAVIDSGIRHDHATGGYNERRAECDAAASALGVKVLRDLPDDVNLERLPAVLARRVRHVVGENRRTLDAVEAIEHGDVPRLGSLINASHASLRDEFEVSVPPIDALVDRVQSDPDAYGARMTGGGFGGSVLVLAKPGCGRAVAERATRGVGSVASVVLPLP